jgi:hypothetical protein
MEKIMLRQVQLMTAEERERYDDEWVDWHFRDWQKTKSSSTPPPDHADPSDDIEFFVGLGKSAPFRH